MYFSFSVPVRQPFIDRWISVFTGLENKQQCLFDDDLGICFYDFTRNSKRVEFIAAYFFYGKREHIKIKLL